MKRCVFLGTGLLLMGLGLGAGTSAWADAQTKNEEAYSLDEVVVTATKTEEARKDIPAAVITKDAADVEESAANSVGELLANEPGVDWRTYGDSGGASQSIQIRGMGSDKTQVMVNGLRINSPSLGSSDVGGLPLSNIERIEVVKGAGSVLYGSGAMGGTVNIITKSPERDRDINKASAAYGTEDTYQLSAESGMFTCGDFGYYLTADKIESDGFRDNSDLDHQDATLKLVYDKGPAFNTSLYSAVINREYGVPGVEPGAGHPVKGSVFYNQESASLVNNGEDENIHTVLKANSKLNNWFSAGIQGSLLKMRNDNISRDNADNFWYGTLAGEGTDTSTENQVLGVEGNLVFTPLDGVELLTGMSYEDTDWNNDQVGLDANGNQKTSTKVANDASVYTKGVYAELQYRINPFIKMTGGFRNEDHSTFGNEGIPRFGLVLNPTQTTVIKASHGKHFKAPTMNDLFWPDDGGMRGNPDLEPETGWHTDVTVEQSAFDDKILFTASYFDWTLDDKIIWAENSAYPSTWGGYMWTPMNVDESNGRGGEFGVKMRILSCLDSAVSYTYTDAEDKSGGVTRDAQYVPENMFKVEMIHFTQNGLTTTATVRYTGERNYYSTSRTAVLDAYTTVDLKIEQIIKSQWRLSLKSCNLLDEEYDTYVGSFTDGSGNPGYGNYPGAGRSVLLTVGYEF